MIEAKYSSSLVTDLPEYTENNLTDNDFLLRLTSTIASDDVALMKQSVNMFLDIFAKVCGEELATSSMSTNDILKPFLDTKLIPKDEFMTWYYEKLELMKQIQSKMDELQELLISIKPINYKGRIIVSTIDDTEQKVIRNYGGKKWRRIVNFLRGVSPGSPMAGSKVGEEYVCLREANIPIHTHQLTIDNTSSNHSSSSGASLSKEKWLCKNLIISWA